MVCEGRRIQRIEDVFDDGAKQALTKAILRNVMAGDWQRGDMRLVSDHPDIDGLILAIPPEVAAA